MSRRQINELQAPISMEAAKPGMELLAVERASAPIQHPRSSIIDERQERTSEKPVVGANDVTRYQGADSGVQRTVASSIVVEVRGNGVVDRLRNGRAPGE